MYKMELEGLESVIALWREDITLRMRLLNVAYHLYDNHIMHLDIINDVPEGYACGIAYGWIGQCAINLSVNQYAKVGSQSIETAKTVIRDIKGYDAERGTNVWD